MALDPPEIPFHTLTPLPTTAPQAPCCVLQFVPQPHLFWGLHPMEAQEEKCASLPRDEILWKLNKDMLQHLTTNTLFTAWAASSIPKTKTGTLYYFVFGSKERHGNPYSRPSSDCLPLSAILPEVIKTSKQTNKQQPREQKQPREKWPVQKHWDIWKYKPAQTSCLFKMFWIPDAKQDARGFL